CNKTDYMKKWLFFKSKYVVIVSLFLSFPTLSANSKLDSLLVVLDKTIEKEEYFTIEKERRIENLKLSIPFTTTLENKFQLYKNIYTEYKAFVTDSAYYYSLQSHSLAKQEKNPFWINESTLQISYTLTISGMYPEAIEILNSMDKEELTD